MRRQVSFEKISDGNRYSRGSMVRLYAGGCAGCSYCCREMTETIILDPWDIYMLCSRFGEDGIRADFSYLLANGYVSIGFFDGLTLPGLGMRDDGSCMFLKDGRCFIHSHRPGFCRLFPLGRIYEDDGFSYFLQKDECMIKNRSKVKIEKWLGIAALPEYERYVLDWHKFTEQLRAEVSGNDTDTAKAKNLRMLEAFFVKPYDLRKDFYSQYYERR